MLFVSTTRKETKCIVIAIVFYGASTSSLIPMQDGLIVVGAEPRTSGLWLVIIGFLAPMLQG